VTAPGFPPEPDECLTYELAEALLRSAQHAQGPDRFEAWWQHAQPVPDVQ
jgi:hypothetical protein